MKQFRKDILTSAAMSLSLFFLICFAATPGLLGDLGLSFGYYGDFNKAKSIIENTGCVGSLKYSLHTDITLEDFHFRVITKSGRRVLVFFNDSMDINQVCNSPKGIIVSHPWRIDGDQRYSKGEISERLKGKGIQVRNIKDMLCNLAELVPLLEANYNDESIPVISRFKSYESSQYIHIGIYKEGEEEFFIYPESGK